MNPFDDVRFHGNFRDYQQRVLDHAQDFLEDGRIHIVAAPGSGKTVLGLELIRRLASPCLILSPTTAIRAQWGERFRDLFLDGPDRFESLFSYDLHQPRLITCITYQALYSAVEKKSAESEDDPDCSDVDLFEAVRAAGITTVCLDEAHHLKNEWQKALEKFLSALEGKIRLIALTATPPYDSDGTEWSRYTDVCGEIDEEIFVPELVAQRTLCPHQDYVYFNYPTEAETRALQAHRERAKQALLQIGHLPWMGALCERLNAERDFEKLFFAAEELIALLAFLQGLGYPVDRWLIRQMTARRGLPRLDMATSETAVRYLLTGDLTDDGQKEEILRILRTGSVYEKGRVTLTLDDRLKRALISSAGKLESICRIADSEISSMGDRLRMLILTDYIKKESLAGIAKEEYFGSVNVVTIFESLRRLGRDAKIGVLSGSLVILPESLELPDPKAQKTPIPDTDYCTVEGPGSPHGIVATVGRLFEQGEIQILIGTKSLLGEGWDAPCVNSLILASFVGSYVLSNQMRGRAIRTDASDPGKVSNIWHLVTVEPDYLFKDKLSERASAYLAQDKNKLISYDYEQLKRRFDCFMGPNYTTGEIESGIERITAIMPPFDRKGIAAINADMLDRAADRSAVAMGWQGTQSADGRLAVTVETMIPREKKVPVFTFFNFALLSLLLTLEALLSILFRVFIDQPKANLPILALILLLLPPLCAGIYKFAVHINPARSMKTLGMAVYRALCECELISPGSKAEAQEDQDRLCVSLYLRGATVHDQNVFNTAMTELLSPIVNPRYILIEKRRIGGYRYKMSFACPTVLGKKKEYAETLARQLKKNTGRFELIYTYREDGRRLIRKCWRHSYLTQNEKVMKRYRAFHV